MLEFTDRGIYCPQANIYIDPWKTVDRAIITHGHSDHARRGNKYYLSHKNSECILRLRLGNNINLQTLEYGEKIFINGITISLHPAGHIFGSSQIRLECNGKVWVISGDYKLEDDGVSTPFEAIRCNVFISECTFGLPVFRWKPQDEVYYDINKWWNDSKNNGRTCILTGYPLGKAQRLLKHLDPSIGQIFAHPSIWEVNEAIRNSGGNIPFIDKIDPEKNPEPGSLILATPSVLSTPWIKKFKPLSTGNASGWMNLWGAKRRSLVDRGFVLSDHADWDGLLKAIEATGAQKVCVMHGYVDSFCRFLNEKGYDAHTASTMWEGEPDVENG